MQIEPVARQFFDFEELLEARPFGAGHINDTFKVSLLQNGVVKIRLVQRLNHLVFREPAAVMHNIHLVAEHLQKQAYPLEILTPFADRSGGLLHTDADGNYWRAFPFFEKTVAFDKVENPEQAYQAAKAFGSFLSALDDMDAGLLKTTIPGFHDGLERLDYFKTVLQRAIPGRLKAAKKAVAEILENQALFKKIASLPLPLRVTHHDTKINNVLMDAATLLPVCVIDLDTVMPGVVLSDFGDMMRTFTSPADEDEPDFSKVEMQFPVFQALMEGFFSEMGDKLTVLEKENLHDGGRWLTLMQAVRFLADYLEGDVYYKIKYPGHNLVRAGNQLKLFRSMTKQLAKAGG